MDAAVALDAAAAAVAVAAAFFAVLAATPFLMVPMTVRFAPVAAVALAAAGFLTTVAVLPSLDSLTRRPVRVAGRTWGGLLAAGAARLVRDAAGAGAAAGAAEAELVVEEVVVLRVGAGRAAFALSTMFVRADRAVVGAFVGEAGLEKAGLAGEAIVRSRGR